MLDESSYLTAVYVYVGAACAMLLYLCWWLGRHWRPGWVALVVFVAAALLLTPAYPKEGTDTMAPALIVAVFQIFTADIDSAQHALKPLGFFSGLAVVAALLLRLTLFRRPRAGNASRGRPPVNT